jgi:hypothetical protein
VDGLTEVFEQYARVIESHRRWLRSFDAGYATKWERLVKGDSEAAICEAATRELFQGHGITVVPNEGLSHGGPDYLCEHGGSHFYVEATCITKAKAARRSRLPDLPQAGGRTARFCLLTPVLLGKLCHKVPQVCNLEWPCVVVIGTLHFQASAVCFRRPFVEQLLSGTPKVAYPIDVRQGRAIGEPYQVTELSDSVFIRFEKGPDGRLESARNNVSAVLLCGFGCDPAEVVGLLHPNPKHGFDRRLLPGIEFVKLVDGCWGTGRLAVEWV